MIVKQEEFLNSIVVFVITDTFKYCCRKLNFYLKSISWLSSYQQDASMLTLSGFASFSSHFLFFTLSLCADFVSLSRPRVK